MTGCNTKLLTIKIQRDLQELNGWFINNHLTLNVNKTNCMLFSPTKKNVSLTIKLEDVLIKQVKETEFSGVWLDENFSWNRHISHINTKIASGLYALCTHKRLMTDKTK